MRFTWAFTGVLAVVALASCGATPGGGEDETFRPATQRPSPSAQPSPRASSVTVEYGAPAETTPEPENSPSPSTRPSAETIAPDPALMAGMSCAPVSDELEALVWTTYGDEADEGFVVEVGEGLEAGSLWSVLVYKDGAGDDRWFLTDGDQLINIGSVYATGLSGFDTVRWDEARLERGQSALAVALACLGSDYPIEKPFLSR